MLPSYCLIGYKILSCNNRKADCHLSELLPVPQLWEMLQLPQAGRDMWIAGTVGGVPRHHSVETLDHHRGHSPCGHSHSKGSEHLLLGKEAILVD